VSVLPKETDTRPAPPGRNRHSRTARWLATLLLGLVPGLTSCGQDYCDAVEENQAELTDVTASGSPGALLEALPIFRDLAEQAPDDIRDDWKAFLDPLEELDDALRDADVDPGAYDADELPVELSEEERSRIRAAGAALADPTVVQALDGVQQQAKDVCHTPLSQ
jgi:hypothetical protein